MEEAGLETQRAIERLAKKIHAGYFASMEPKSTLPMAFKKDVPAPCRKQGRRRGPLTLEE